MTGISNYGGVSTICGIIYGETESPNEGASLRCDEPPVPLQLRLQMERAAPRPTTRFSERRTIKNAIWPLAIGRSVVASQAHNSYETRPGKPYFIPTKDQN